MNKSTVKAKVGPTIANLLKFSAQTSVSSSKVTRTKTANGKSINLSPKTIMTQPNLNTVKKKSPKANFAHPPNLGAQKNNVWVMKTERARFDKTRIEFFERVKTQGGEGKNNSFDKGSCNSAGCFNYLKNDSVTNKNVNDNLHVASGFKTTSHLSVSGVDPSQMIGNLPSDVISRHHSPRCNFFDPTPIIPGAKSRSSGPSFVNINSYLNNQDLSKKFSALPSTVTFIVL